MRTLFVLAAALIVSAAFVTSTAAPAHANINSYWTGTITHVSTENLKVKNKAGDELSFLIVPKFKNIWSDDGKTTYQMSYLKPGMDVKVTYDQKALGARHADKIVVLRH
ncbi:MAG: hypothetical protein JO219_07580 [Candidatus Eremiobacteraeota bacterium]|nr:hypothetical protein [Candidatus Eremiobacteraeota bacterium]MBV8365725.1 hypothetical protein [Candidatus Eremiobacteraeota bacterium]